MIYMCFAKVTPPLYKGLQLSIIEVIGSSTKKGFDPPPEIKYIKLPDEIHRHTPIPDKYIAVISVKSFTGRHTQHHMNANETT